jgi:hypothetical protein
MRLDPSLQIMVGALGDDLLRQDSISTTFTHFIDKLPIQ